MKACKTLGRIDKFGCVAIPKTIREKCGIKEGDIFEIYYDEKTRTVAFKRFETDAELREKWVDEWHYRFLASDAISKRIGNKTIVSYMNVIMTTTCKEGTTYDRRVGEAVCFAKLNGECIPDYI